jgi:hypothetical protein
VGKIASPATGAVQRWMTGIAAPPLRVSIRIPRRNTPRASGNIPQIAYTSGVLAIGIQASLGKEPEMRGRRVVAGLTMVVVPLMAVAKSPSPEVPLEKALTMPAEQFAAVCKNASMQRQYVELAEVGGTVMIGGRRVTSRNAAAVAAELDAQLEVCRQVAEQRGVAAVQGDWVGRSTGCDRSGSGLAAIVGEPGAVVNFEQDGTSLELTLSARDKEGESYSFPAFGTVLENSITVIDPFNSDYTLKGEVTGSTIVLRPDTKRILAAWPKWAGPPAREDLDSCVVTLERQAPEAAP